MATAWKDKVFGVDVQALPPDTPALQRHLLAHSYVLRFCPGDCLLFRGAVRGVVLAGALTSFNRTLTPHHPHFDIFAPQRVIGDTALPLFALRCAPDSDGAVVCLMPSPCTHLTSANADIPSAPHTPLDIPTFWPLAFPTVPAGGLEAWQSAVDHLTSHSHTARHTASFQCAPLQTLIAPDGQDPSSSDAKPPKPSPLVAVVIGSRGCGKSTLASLLCHGLLSHHPTVRFLETDLGQSEFTPPGLITLTELHAQPRPVERTSTRATLTVRVPGASLAWTTQGTHALGEGWTRAFTAATHRAVLTASAQANRAPLVVGPPFTKLTLPDYAFFVGANSPALDPAHFMRAVRAVLEEARTTDVPLVINTVGWLTGLGAALLHELLILARPSVLVHVGVATVETTLALLFPPHPLDAVTLLSHGEAHLLNSAEEVANAVQMVCTVVPHGAVPSSPPLHPRDLRALAFRAWLLAPQARLRSVPWARVAVIVLHSRVRPELTLLALLRTVVALCVHPVDKTPAHGCVRVLPHPPALLRCVGLAYVERVDMKQQCLVLRTPAPPAVLARVTLLVRGQLDTAPQLQSQEQFRCVEYGSSLQLRGAGSGTMHSRGNIQRKRLTKHRQ